MPWSRSSRTRGGNLRRIERVAGSSFANSPEALVEDRLLATQCRHELVLLLVLVFLVILLLADRLAGLRVGFATGQRLVGIVLLGRHLLFLAIGCVRRVGKLRRATLGLALL